MSKRGKTLSDALQRREGTCDGDRISAVGAQIDVVGVVPAAVASKAKKLFLSNNNLRSLQHIDQFHGVETLSLTHNDIKYLEELYHLRELRGLRKLSLEGNLVTRVPFYRDFVLGHCSALQALDGLTVTEEDRLRAALNFRRACLFISRAITGGVRNALLGQIVARRVAHNEMRSSVFGRFKLVGCSAAVHGASDGCLRLFRSLHAAFVAAARPSVSSLSQLVGLLKSAGVFREVLLRCEATMSRELQVGRPSRAVVARR